MKNAYEDYLQAGGSLLLSGELNNTLYNVLNDSIDAFIEQVGGVFAYGSTVAGNTTITSNDYAPEGLLTTSSTYYTPSGSPITTSDGSYITSDQHVAEWGPDVLSSNIHGTVIAHMDFNYLTGNYGSNSSTQNGNNLAKEHINWLEGESQAVTGGITTDLEYLPIGGLKTTYGWTNTNNNTKSYVEAFNMGNNVYIGGGFEHLDWVWDDAQITVASTEGSYDVSAQETGNRGLAFSSDGTKFFVVGYQGNDVGEYSMSTAWDVSTASYVDAFSLSGQGGVGRMGLDFNTDGTKMFVVSYQNDSIHEYTLSTGWDVSTASYVDAFDVSSQDTDPRGLEFNTDGTKMFMTGDQGNDINEYTLTTGFDVSTASYVDSLDVSSYDTTVRDIAFNDDGTKMFYSGHQNNDVHLWTLSTAFDISTATYNSAVSLPSFDTGAEDIVFSSDGSKLFVSGNDDNTIDEYTLFSGFDDWDKAYVAVNSDMDGSDEDDAPTVQDDHYLVVGVDTDGDGNLWETTDVFDLDKIFIKDDSADFLTQDSDASGDYYFKITPVTYANSTWTVETDNTVTVSNTTGYNDYLDLTSNSDFDDINYAIIETESALISDVLVTY